MARANLSVPARAAGGEEFVACAVDGGTLPFQVDADVAADQCLVELYLGSGIIHTLRMYSLVFAYSQDDDSKYIQRTIIERGTHEAVRCSVNMVVQSSSLPKAFVGNHSRSLTQASDASSFYGVIESDLRVQCQKPRYPVRRAASLSPLHDTMWSIR